jgi:hypothetical protein
MSKSFSKDAKAAPARWSVPAQGSSVRPTAVHPALRSVVERFAKLRCHSFDGFLLYDAGFVLNATTGVARLFQRTPSDLQRCRVSDLITRESRPLLLQHLRSVVRSSCPAMGVRADGSRFPLELTVQGSLIFNGRRLKVVALRDVTRDEEAAHLSDRTITRRKPGTDAVLKPVDE